MERKEKKRERERERAKMVYDQEAVFARRERRRDRVLP